MKNEELEEALNYDSLKRAEEITGESYKDSDFTTMVGLMLNKANQVKKNNLLKKNNDTSTFSDQTLMEWKCIVADLGFQLIFSLKFKSSWGDDETFFVYWNNGILLVADTFRGERINTAKIYLEFKKDTNEWSDGLVGCNTSPMGDGLYSISYDCREGLRYKLTQLKQEGKILELWSKIPFLWILHHGDTKIANYDYHKINDERIAQFPKYVQKAMGFKN